MQNQKSKNFLEPADFFRETLVCLRNDENISDKLGMMFQMLGEKYVNHPKFVRYHHIRDDLISCAVLACVKGFPKFRPYRNDVIRDDNGEIITSTKVEWNGELVEYDYKTCNNPFAFFTTCATNEILQFLKSEYGQKNIVNKLKLENGLEADEGYMDMMREKDDTDYSFSNRNSDDGIEETEIVDENSRIQWENE